MTKPSDNTGESANAKKIIIIKRREKGRDNYSIRPRFQIGDLSVQGDLSNSL
jgi:hypothetical protein